MLLQAHIAATCGATTRVIIIRRSVIQQQWQVMLLNNDGGRRYAALQRWQVLLQKNYLKKLNNLKVFSHLLLCFYVQERERK